MILLPTEGTTPKKTMAIDESNDIEIERAHRPGGKRDDRKPRPIVAKFLIPKSIFGNLHISSKVLKSELLTSFQKKLLRHVKSSTL